MGGFEVGPFKHVGLTMARVITAHLRFNFIDNLN